MKTRWLLRQVDEVFDPSRSNRRIEAFDCLPELEGKPPVSLGIFDDVAKADAFLWGLQAELRWPGLTMLRSDWGEHRLPDSANLAYYCVPKNRWGLPDRRTRQGRKIAAYERRQLMLANATKGDFTPEEFV